MVEESLDDSDMSFLDNELETTNKRNKLVSLKQDVSRLNQ